MVANYNKLWKLLIDKGMKKTDLQSSTRISTSVIAKMGKGESVSMDVLMRICTELDCNIGDIVDFVPTDKDITATENKENKQFPTEE